jgi:hypothetical protein
MLRLINEHRAANSVGPLKLSDTLNKAAAWKSEHMASLEYFAHDDTPINRSWVQRIRDCGYSYNTWLGENLAAGNESAAATFQQWLNSPGHNANMLSTNFNAIGIGRAYDGDSPYRWYWSTDFGGYSDGYTPPSPPTPTPGPAEPPASTVCADLDGNGVVLVSDIMYVVERYMTPDLSADLDASGSVGVGDILITVEQFGDSC